MKLKSLELQGFKSFPDKTVLTFNGSGVTAILGPNGSGKSNVSDAVRWVLGELSSKNIRGTKMEDVIFGGSDTRRPMSFAEVTLVMDNTGDSDRLASDYDEVTVTRRYYRSGSSEYLINRAPVRLRDINELFMNTGIGRSGYSIIGQGKIAEIISQRSEDRRHIFEEAAGIAKYRYQKQDAEKKLAQVDENSARVQDILHELSGRVGRLEKDAAKAKIYLELYDRKKAADVSLGLFEIDGLKAKSSEAELRFSAVKLELESADSEREELEARSQALYGRAQEGKLREDDISSRIAAQKNAGRDLQSANMVLENDIRHIDEQLSRTEEEQKLREAALAKAEEDALRLASEKEERKAQKTALEDRLAALRSDAGEKQAVCDRLTREMEENERLVQSCSAGITELRVRIGALQGSHETDTERAEQLREELDRLSAEAEMLAGRMEKAARIIASYDERIREGKETSEKLTASAEEKQKEAEAARERAAKLQLDISGKKQRADALRRMDELLEGYGQSVRAVMKAAGEHRLRGICGPVSRLISVEPEVSVAIETALGANIQNIVVEDENAAKAAIAYLKQNNAGRSTFYPITAIRPQPMNVPVSELSCRAGYVGIASELCRCEEKYRNVISYMLGRTAVFDGIDHAAETAKALGYRVRIVTLDGQLINAGGSFTGGSVRRDSGMLTRGADIEKLNAETERQSVRLKRENDLIAGLQEEIRKIREEAASGSAQQNLLLSLRQAEATQLEVLRAQSEADERRLAALRRDEEAAGSQREQYGAELARLNDALQKAEADLSRAEQKGEELSRAFGEADDLLAAWSKQINELLVSEAALEKDIEAAENAVAVNASAKGSLAEQLAAGKAFRETLAARRADAGKRIAENRSAASAIGTDVDGLEHELAEVLAGNAELERRQNLLREDMKEKERKRELLFREYTRLESDTEQLRSETDRLTARLWDDYELTYGTAQALGYPPVTAENRVSVTAEREELRLKLKQLGSVNASAIEEYRTEKERLDFTEQQFRDLSAAREELSRVVERLEKEMRVRFADAVTEINRNFQVIFRELFGGGNAEIALSDPDSPLECGIEINAAPPGKIIKSMSLMSGGEQSFTAIALIFAILNVNPTPFCIFDEIEAALDEVNVAHFAEYMKRYCGKTQFIVITHRRGTMEAADMIYGVSMPERGISRVLALNVNEVEQKIGVKLK